ncbi:MAG: response regulator [Desulfobacterales bacterium]|jgi:CheY-like chemotaxis protein|nr:response regulator [Desulfobacterales bacterium]
MDKPKVLIVDDEIDMRIFISTLFETNGYQPVVSRDGKAGLEKAREIIPDLIILDVMMPGEGGVAMYQGLKMDSTLRNIPVIMLSAVPRKTFIHYLKMLNFRLEDNIPDPSQYVEKPPDAELLLSIARRVLGSKAESDLVK